VKVGRTALAADMALSHSGALAGEDAAWDAVFERYGVQRVADLDTLATTLMLFAQPHPVGPGSLVSLHDSGGERSLLIDLAAASGTPLTELAPETMRALERILDPGLPAVNPLDAWSAGGGDWHEYMTRCFATLLSDPGAALGAVVHARGPDSSIPPPYADYLRGAHAAAGKPVCLVHARQGSGADPLAVALSHEGFPVIDGVPAFLAGARALFAWRDHCAEPPLRPPVLDEAVIARWRRRLADPRPIGEAEASVLLDTLGIPMAELCTVRDEATLLAAAAEMDWPLVLKSAAPGLSHKTEAGGVVLGIADEAALRDAYRRMAARLGPAALLAPMVQEAGVEMILGATRDAHFGPLVVLGIGGVHAELLEDAVVLLPPFDESVAMRAIGRLRMRALLDGLRGAPAVDAGAFCRAAARLSVLVHALGDALEAIDINPLRVLPRGCIGLDALVSARSSAHG
jgi:acyl-CoA synthetase (NDP forming)